MNIIPTTHRAIGNAGLTNIGIGVIALLVYVLGAILGAIDIGTPPLWSTSRYPILSFLLGMLLGLGWLAAQNFFFLR